MTTDCWTIAEAKARLSEVLNRVQQAPQVITRRGKEFVVLDGEEYRRLTGKQKTFKELVLEGPTFEGVDLERDRSMGREIDL
ncbi:MAG: type II toxin-antitoxin system Phd/YefM family antitoxin [Planctomycetota bacterium]